jgi:ATP-dependent Clp protease ATP-binding subunit ClpA
MFERYTEKARRVVFFARYEASQFGSPFIETEHLLLGLLREYKEVVRHVLLRQDFDAVRQEVTSRIKPGKPFPTSVDLPLSEHAKRALTYASEEADRLNHRPIDTAHLLLGLMRDEKFASAESLSHLGTHLESLRQRVETLGAQRGHAKTGPPITHRRTVTGPDVIMLRSAKRSVEDLHREVDRLRKFHWTQKSWKLRNIVTTKDGKKFSFDLTLAKKSPKFTLVKGGWKKDQCAICRWELFESKDTSHGTGFTNGKDWICLECHHRFIDNDFFSSSYSDIT